MFYNKIDILFLQEHNIKDNTKLDYLDKYCRILINFSTCLKGGTAILIRSNSGEDVLNWEADVNGLIVSAKCKFLNTVFHLVNVYAPSGSSKKTIKEELFKNDILYFLRNNTSKLILGGDFNSITSKRDCSNPDTDLVSPALTQLKNQLKLKDAWLIINNDIGSLLYNRGAL